MDLCSVCKLELDDDDAFECDGCTVRYHLKCGGATRKEIVIRKNSNCLRVFCKDCLVSPITTVAENVKTIMKFVHKIDLFNQKQIETNDRMNNLLVNTVEKVKNIGDKLEIIDCDGHKNGSSKVSFANVLKSKVNPVVVVKPKEKQASKKTEEDIRKKIVDKNVKVCNARNIKDGGIVLSCENNNDTMKVKQIVEDSYGENYEVRLPEVKMPRLKITNISEKIEEDDLIDEIKKMNGDLKDIEMKVITLIKKTKKAYSYRELVIEVNGDAYKKLLKKGVIFLDWRKCRILEHLHIQRCFKCCGFNHISTECKSEQRCSKCAGVHKFDNCQRKNVKCVNCLQVIEKFGADIDANHHAWSKDCKILQRKIEALKNKIEYNTSK